MKFSEMNVWSKVLYVFGVLGLIEAVVVIAFSALMIAGVGLVEAEQLAELTKYAAYFGTSSGEELVKGVCIALIIAYVFTAIISWLEVRAAKNNKKVMIPLVLSAISFVMSVVSIAQNGFATSDIIPTVITVLGLVSCVMIYTNNKKVA